MSGIHGLIFDIQRFSLHDGPGIRTTIFMKGCSNGCGWCHNPESISHETELLYFPKRCVNCGNCVKACPHNCHIIVDGLHTFSRRSCFGCGLCAKACHTNALSIPGRIATVENVMAEVLADIEYYRQSNGGVTLSGGEPVLQYSFCKEILKECKKARIHTIIQTAGNYDFNCLEQLLPYTDLVMYDVKAYSQEIYKRHIHGDREKILGNLERLSDADVPVVARTPVIGSVNDNEHEIALIAIYLQKLKNIKKYILIPYHNLGDAKYNAMDISRKHDYYSPDAALMTLLTEIASKYVTV